MRRFSRSFVRLALLASLATQGWLAVGCGGSGPRARSAEDLVREQDEVARVIDAWHAAAAASDEEGYFGLMTLDAIFLGTDATERWNVAQFRSYAHQPFSEGRGWRMRSVRRELIVRGDLAWFDEDLEAVNLGPARGSGVLARQPDGGWRIAHYNLAITVPNERFEAVRALLAGPASEQPPTE